MSRKSGRCPEAGCPGCPNIFHENRPSFQGFVAVSVLCCSLTWLFTVIVPLLCLRTAHVVPDAFSGHTTAAFTEARRCRCPNERCRVTCLPCAKTQILRAATTTTRVCNSANRLNHNSNHSGAVDDRSMPRGQRTRSRTKGMAKNFELQRLSKENTKLYVQNCSTLHLFNHLLFAVVAILWVFVEKVSSDFRDFSPDVQFWTSGTSRRTSHGMSQMSSGPHFVKF